MNSRRVNDLMKMAKTTDADTLGRAYVISQSIAWGELNGGEQKLLPPLIEEICKQATKHFPPGSGVGYDKLMDWVRINQWIINNRYFTQCQMACVQRDIALLKGYSHDFLITERIKAHKIDTDVLYSIKDYTLDSYISGIKDDNKENEGKAITSRLEYSYAWFTAYNLVIELSADIFDVPELKNYCLNLEEDKDRLQQIMWDFNEIIGHIENDSTLAEGEQFERVCFIKEFKEFYEKNGLEMKPTNEALSKATALMRDFSGYKDDYMFFAILFPVINEVLFNE